MSKQKSGLVPSDTLLKAASFIQDLVRTLEHVMGVNQTLSQDLLGSHDRDDWHEVMHLEREYVVDCACVFAKDAERYCKVFRQAASTSDEDGALGRHMSKKALKVDLPVEDEPAMSPRGRRMSEKGRMPPSVTPSAQKALKVDLPVEDEPEMSPRAHRTSQKGRMPPSVMSPSQKGLKVDLPVEPVEEDASISPRTRRHAASLKGAQPKEDPMSPRAQSSHKLKLLKFVVKLGSEASSPPNEDPPAPVVHKRRMSIKDVKLPKADVVVSTLHCELRLEMERAQAIVHRTHRAVRGFSNSIETLCQGVHDLATPIDPCQFATLQKTFLASWMPLSEWLSGKTDTLEFDEQVPAEAAYSNDIRSFQTSKMWKTMQGHVDTRLQTQHAEDVNRHSPQGLSNSIAATLSRTFGSLSKLMCRIEDDKAHLLTVVQQTVENAYMWKADPRKVESRRLQQLLDVSKALGSNAVLSAGQRKQLQDCNSGLTQLPSPRSVLMSMRDVNGNPLFLPHHTVRPPDRVKESAEVQAVVSTYDEEVQAGEDILGIVFLTENTLTCERPVVSTTPKSMRRTSLTERKTSSGRRPSGEDKVVGKSRRANSQRLSTPQPVETSPGVLHPASRVRPMSSARKTSITTKSVCQTTPAEDTEDVLNPNTIFGNFSFCAENDESPAPTRPVPPQGVDAGVNTTAVTSQQSQGMQCLQCRKAIVDVVEATPYVGMEQLRALEMYNRYVGGPQPQAQFLVNNATRHREEAEARRQQEINRRPLSGAPLSVSRSASPTRGVNFVKHLRNHKQRKNID